MKLTLRQVYNAIGPLSGISRERFPVSLAWRIQRNLKLIHEEAKQVESLLMELADRYGAKEVQPGFYQVEKEHTQEFEKEKEGLLNNEVDLGIALIPLNDFGHDISPADLNALEFMFEFPKDEQPKEARQRHKLKDEKKE